MLDGMTVKLDVNSTILRDALLDGCSLIVKLEMPDGETSTERPCGSNSERGERRIALATALDEQLETGCEAVDVPVEVADGIARNIAELIGEVMAALVCDPYDAQPRGVILGHAAALMEALVALDAGIQRQVMPFDTGSRPSWSGKERRRTSPPAPRRNSKEGERAAGEALGEL